MYYYSETAKKIPIAAEVDVLIAGGGTAGVGAAVAAARNGAKTLVVEKMGWMIGYMDALWGQGIDQAITFQDKNGRLVMKGIPFEIADRLHTMDGAIVNARRKVILDTWTENKADYSYNRWQTSIDPELAKYLAFEMCEEAGAGILLHTWISDVIVEDGKVMGVIVENKAGRQAILAKVVVDSTGDADVAARAGAPFHTASIPERYQVTRSFCLANVDTGKVRDYILSHLDEFGYVVEPVDEDVPAGLQKPMFAFRVKGSELEFSRNGLSIKGGPGSHSKAMGLGIKKGVAGVGGHVDNIDALDPWQVSKAEVEIRRKAVASWRKLRKEAPGHESCYLMPGYYDLGVRETRLIDGEYTVTLEEMLKGTRHKDAVFQTIMPTDAHLPLDNWSQDMADDTYDIPYRALVPKKVDNLLVAGRCISQDHAALAALRKVNLCIAMGEAAGTAAALSAKLRVTPRALDVSILQRQLIAQGVVLSDQLTAELCK